MSSNSPCQLLKLPLRKCLTLEPICLRTAVASRTTIWLSFCDITDSFSISVRLLKVGMNNVTITSAQVLSSQLTSFIDTITSFLTKNHCGPINAYYRLFTNHADLTRFNKIATQGAPQMAVDKEANSLSRVYSYYSKFNLCLFYV